MTQPDLLAWLTDLASPWCPSIRHFPSRKTLSTVLGTDLVELFMKKLLGGSLNRPSVISFVVKPMIESS